MHYVSRIGGEHSSEAKERGRYTLYTISVANDRVRPARLAIDRGDSRLERVSLRPHI